MLKEKQTIEGYNLSDRTEEVSISTDGQIVELGQWENKPIEGSVSFKKVDQRTHKPLAGVVFTLSNENEHYRAISDEGGLVQFDQVRYGQYELKETETLNAYVLSEDVLEVSIETEGQAIDLKTIENAPKTTMVLFKKVDQSGKALAGAEFELKLDDETVYKATSDQDGLVQFEGVVYGEYLLTEIKAPEGYEPMKEAKKVVVDTEEAIHLDDVVNQKKPVKRLHTGLPSSFMLWMSLFMMTLLASLWFVKKSI